MNMAIMTINIKKKFVGMTFSMPKRQQLQKLVKDQKSRSKKRIFKGMMSIQISERPRSKVKDKEKLTYHEWTQKLIYTYKTGINMPHTIFHN